MDLQVRIERDTLGMDANLPRCLHADVLEACDRALERSLAAQARSADAPRPPDAPGAPPQPGKEPPAPPPRAPPPGPITAAQLAQARAVARACLPAAAPAPQAAAQEERAIAAAEAAWLPAGGGGRG
jgi:hypothetical protein